LPVGSDRPLGSSNIIDARARVFQYYFTPRYVPLSKILLKRQHYKQILYLEFKRTIPFEEYRQRQVYLHVGRDKF
jgi:hypothetical protein